MKLQLKHLAPYLPYGLKCEILNYKNDYVGEKYGICNGFYYLGNNVHYTFKDRSTAGKTAHYFKPILRPLSDLTKEIENIVKGEHNNCLVWENWIEHLSDFEGKLQEANILACPYELMQLLLQNHFDVFEIIPKGLAIDKNTL